MDYVLWGHMRWLALVVLAAVLVSGVSGWQRDWRPIYVNHEPQYNLTNDVLNAPNGNEDNFKILRVEGDRVFIGSKNLLFYLQFGPFMALNVLHWPVDHATKTLCRNRGRKECDNYIRVVVVKDTERAYYICGTYAYAPRCGYFTLDSSGGFSNITDNENGIGISPFNPTYNSTAIYTDGKWVTATTSDANELKPMIMLKFNGTKIVRTKFRESTFLNEPQFISSDHKNDKVYFFFREVAVENINCGKAIFSRVAQVCKNNHQIPGFDYFTSYFKARLNCSIPGDYPFYFDKLESATEFGLGNHRPTSDSGDRADMVYGVFNTPDHAISGSAVCAFRHSDIEETFGGMFKNQDSYNNNWQPTSWDATQGQHPTLCGAQSHEVPQGPTSFVMTHPLMNEAVPAAGGMPLLVLTGSRSKFTQIAVDWQVLAGDGKYYDVMFVGTDDGRVIKAINKGTKNVESVVIEDIQVLDVGDPVVSLKVLRHGTCNNSLLVVASRRKVASIPVHRCQKALTCSECMALQDPYCVWNNTLGCVNASASLSNISPGTQPFCSIQNNARIIARNEASDRVRRSLEKVNEIDDTEKANEIDDKPDERLVSASTTTQEASLAIEIVIVAVIVSIISLGVGFFIGFTFQAYRYARDRRNVFHTDHSNLTPKQMNDVVNPGKINSTETKPMTKPIKVYK